MIGEVGLTSAYTTILLYLLLPTIGELYTRSDDTSPTMSGFERSQPIRTLVKDSTLLGSVLNLLLHELMRLLDILRSFTPLKSSNKNT